ncbi:bestrophin family protein [Flavobacterium psychrotrophum]|uniref:bestrophin family protein n=1 Tax=Flavobacterium psychrotrophum TaxID=2294119 RepID=UPI000E310C18|nr:bestrophin family ion channel [Flavobacterium psychrotrophum]
MISYNPKEWFSFIFRFHKGDTIRKLLPLMIGIAAYSAGIAWLETSYWKLSETSHVKNLTVVHALLGFVISMLLVFRTNTAYDRWWEGRRLWGALVNNSRNFAIKVAVMIKDKNDKELFRKLIPAFAYVLNKHLKDEEVSHELFDNAILRPDHYKHKPNQVAKAILKHTNDLYTQGKITGDQLIVLNAELQSFTDISGACERIKNTPIPYSYSAFIKKFIFFYVMSLPFGYVFQLGYYVIPVVVFVFYVLASLELIAEEIEDPFGTDANDLPLEKISENIRKNVEELIY